MLYFPNGTYRIDQTLYMEQQIGAQFVGESTDGVVIEWHGPAGLVPWGDVDALAAELTASKNRRADTPNGFERETLMARLTDLYLEGDRD